MPSFVAMIILSGSEGFINNFDISFWSEAGQVTAVLFQVRPPSVDFSTPIETLLPSMSPVARYMLLVFPGSIARSEQPMTVKKSVLVVQLPPASVDFHKPPSGVPI